ncbi:PREDICTED: uncharacterized protein LOC108763936 isoform X2 [Trachymyrmex cornetzi]|nr:PREDICTED: uncharacterized protein LOC108763936 isoform X2 [Trachymyrmex cornetzi]XP_018367389.1 PREDICTED: uncharacterized protein LOC108763936 isoform X2 [Trachymyrmex cornetzi]XP_018367390.1 PREDICTED: uncharacterized protein LOC108763936 isoform X2 [Trachymyrmex cornetzi]XP_018367391.1 PREDICTED: uncharacterized protein LOC108763936 isoform X2 [Trachymyrmex cornetzi]XP_018367392.1 PREDICTED: uncharacterized protein LOC108763936 isoform X2 [Trachymyrmex cornetzi]
MDDIERFIRVIQQKRLANQCELERLDEEPSEHRELMKELQNLRRETEQCKENITKHLNMITSHKHSVHKIVHSTSNISGLPVSHDYAQDMTTMFTDAIEFLNNVGDIHKALTNVKENNVDPSKLIQDVTMCTEIVENKLYQIKCSIAQLETLKENTVVLQHLLNSSNNIEDGNIDLTNINNESMDSGSTII